MGPRGTIERARTRQSTVAPSVSSGRGRMVVLVPNEVTIQFMKRSTSSTTDPSIQKRQRTGDQLVLTAEMVEKIPLFRECEADIGSSVPLSSDRIRLLKHFMSSSDPPTDHKVLHQMVIDCSYLGIECKAYLEEFLWIVCEHKETFELYFEPLPYCVQYAHKMVPRYKYNVKAKHRVLELELELANRRSIYDCSVRFMIKYSLETSKLVARSGNLRLLKWICKNGHYFELSADMCEQAATGGNLNMLKWLRSKGCPWFSGTCDRAAESGHLECLKWAHENGCPWNLDTCAYAASGGHIECLKWLRSKGCRWNAQTFTWALNSDGLNVLKWLLENGCPWNEVWTCAVAASDGRLESLKWLRAKGCPWSESTCSMAARGGKLECLKWARQNGCPWDEWTCIEAARYGHLDCYRWARQNGAYCSWKAFSLYNKVTQTRRPVDRVFRR